MKTNVFLGVLLLMIIMSCSKNEVIENDKELAKEPSPEFTRRIDLGIGDDSFFEEYPKLRTEEDLGSSEEFNEENEVGEDVTQHLVCTRRKVAVEDGSDDFQLFGGLASDIIFPGNLLQGKTVVDPEIITPSIIPVRRAGGTISVNINGGFKQAFREVEEVKVSSIQGAINEIINSSSGDFPANFNIKIEQIESEEQLALEMGLSLKAWKVRAKSSLSFSQEKKFNRTLVKLTQTFYTVNFDIPTRKEDIFPSDVTQAEYAPYISNENPATFISSVSYGRTFYMLVESTSSREIMQAKLNVAYRSLGVSATGSLEVNAFDSLKDLKIKVIAYGGDSEGTIDLVGETSVNQIATKLSKTSNIRTALPLSYKVRSVYDPSRVIGVKLAAEFDIVNCEVKGVLPPSGYKGLFNLFEDGVGAVTQVRDAIILLYNTAGDKYAFYNVAKGKILNEVYRVDDRNGPLGDGAKLTNVGAAYLDHWRNRNSKIRLISQDGLHNIGFTFNKTVFNNGMSNLPQDYNHMNIKFDPVTGINETYFSTRGYEGVYPFAGDKIDAIYFNNINGIYPNDSYSFVSDNGKTLARTKDKRDYLDRLVWNSKLYDLSKDDDYNGLDGIGAIGTVNIGGARERIFFDISGEKFKIIKANGRRLGPFVIN